jgi:A/G-specific adenine glycosylase
MLQQTQVATVLPYFDRFLKRFPDVESLAAAELRDVLAAWSGLGYYRRARALHRAARRIVEENRGRFPATLEEWLDLPGVGRYTAGAVLSIAFNQRHPILDGNVARVLSRVFLVRGDPRQNPARKELWGLAESLLPRRSVSDFNQALMELGALVCTPRKPRCLVCPWLTPCGARGEGLQEVLPEIKARQALVPVTLTVGVVRRVGAILLFRRSEEELMRDLWELPGGVCGEGEAPPEALVREARARYGLEIEPGPKLTEVRHHIMNRKIRLFAFQASLERAPPSKGPEWAWVEPTEAGRYPLSSMTLKVLRAVESCVGLEEVARRGGGQPQREAPGARWSASPRRPRQRR